MLQVLTIISDDISPRLTAEEIGYLGFVLFELHDHTARFPQEPLYWQRVSNLPRKLN